jgi:predicted nucleic acid-binding protein
MIAVDSSVAIAAFGEWHELNQPACAVLLPPSADAQRDLIRKLAGEGRTGGAVYDALVALPAKTAGATLATADRRARSIYELVGVALQNLDERPA